MRVAEGLCDIPLTVCSVLPHDAFFLPLLCVIYQASVFHTISIIIIVILLLSHYRTRETHKRTNFFHQVLLCSKDVACPCCLHQFLFQIVDNILPRDVAMFLLFFLHLIYFV